MYAFNTAISSHLQAKSLYTLTVYASDGAFPSRHDSASVAVKVLDRNDGAPRFSQESHVISVPENVAKDRLHAIVAVDQDEGGARIGGVGWLLLLLFVVGAPVVDWCCFCCCCSCWMLLPSLLAVIASSHFLLPSPSPSPISPTSSVSRRRERTRLLLDHGRQLWRQIQHRVIVGDFELPAARPGDQGELSPRRHGDGQRRGSTAGAAVGVRHHRRQRHRRQRQRPQGNRRAGMDDWNERNEWVT